jgi:hypothetical protein
MEAMLIAALIYIAVGAACCAHPRGRALPGDFGWRGQFAVFRDTLPDVLCWPLVLWRLTQGSAPD